MGGLVLNSTIHAGRRGNPGALGSLALALALALVVAGAPAPDQLLSAASLFTLEQYFAAAGLDERAAYDERALQAPWLAHTEPWRDAAAWAMALACYNWEGARRPTLPPGQAGPDACAVGAALPPLHAHFAPDHELFLKILANPI